MRTLTYSTVMFCFIVDEINYWALFMWASANQSEIGNLQCNLSITFCEYSQKYVPPPTPSNIFSPVFLQGFRNIWMNWLLFVREKDVIKLEEAVQPEAD